MARPPVEMNKPTLATSGAPDAFRSLRAEMDRLFDRFAGGWGFPSLGRMLDPAPTLHCENSFSVPSPWTSQKMTPVTSWRPNCPDPARRRSRLWSLVIR